MAVEGQDIGHHVVGNLFQRVVRHIGDDDSQLRAHRLIDVVNADTEVKKHAMHANVDTLYVAKGDYLGMNGNYAAGILEGVTHYLPEMNTWLSQNN